MKKPLTTPAARRTCLRVAALLPLALAGCGFALRGAPHLSFRTIYLALPDTALKVGLQRQLQAVDGVRVLTDPKQRAQADVVLESAGESRRRVIVSRTATGEVREIELHLNFSFRMVTPQGTELLAEARIEREMDQSYAESEALSKEAEAELLYRNMQDDIVQQVMRRLATVKR